MPGLFHFLLHFLLSWHLGARELTFFIFSRTFLLFWAVSLATHRFFLFLLYKFPILFQCQFPSCVNNSLLLCLPYFSIYTFDSRKSLWKCENPSLLLLSVATKLKKTTTRRTRNFCTGTTTTELITDHDLFIPAYINLFHHNFSLSNFSQVELYMQFENR